MFKLSKWWRKSSHDSEVAKSWESMINFSQLPRHIAIIVDGNGRWAHLRGLPRTAGHRAGMNVLKEIVNICGEIGISVLTVYAFSTENWTRPVEEVEFLMQLLVEYIGGELEELYQKGVKVRVLGEIKELPSYVQEEVQRATKVTADNQRLILNVAINYGGRREILKAINEIIRQVSEGSLRPEEVCEDTVSSRLYTAGLPDPDLVIRSSGEMRLSNFLLWQVAYAELWFSTILWPDFSREHFYQAIVEYQQRHRRFGGL